MINKYHGDCVDASDPNKPNFEFRDDFVCKDWLGTMIRNSINGRSNGYENGMFLCRTHKPVTTIRLTVIGVSIVIVVDISPMNVLHMVILP